jgi:uncharacterized ferritin-like protein (DUF455 family)
MENQHDTRAVAILERNVAEEVEHVGKGFRWFCQLARLRGLEPEAHFKSLLDKHGLFLKPPFNASARAQAGMPRSWFDASVSVN